MGTPTLPIPSAELDGGDQDCGSGLLLSLTGAVRRIAAGEVLLLRTREKSVLADLPVWARLAGHELVAVQGDGPWELLVRRGSPDAFGAPGAAPGPDRLADVLSTGAPAELGARLWLYSNFHCNLACTYCCAQSSPKADPRSMPPDLAAAAVEEFLSLGGKELLVTGGEPFLHPELDQIVAHAAVRVPVTVLTNAMVFGRGRRRQMLESMDTARVVLQVSLDSASPGLHDAQRGVGSHTKAIDGIYQARSLGFRVKVAATLHENDLASAAALHARLDQVGIPVQDRLVRPVAHEGFADAGMQIGLDTIEPEPTLTVDGAWWHPVAVTSNSLRVSKNPLPLAEIFAVMRDILNVQSASQTEGRHVFRCT